MQIFLVTSAAMIAFAANSVLGRVALGWDAIDPASYSFIRLASGAAMLAALVLWQSNGNWKSALGNGNWFSAVSLFVYAAAFSFAYLVLDTGFGALVLFACVQATMIGWGLFKGERPALLQWTGMAIAFAAFVWLVSPGIAAPDPIGTAMMGLSGIAWGVYSLIGRSATDPLAATAANFLRSVPFALVLALIFALDLELTAFGIAMAVLSGAVTSGLGYALWYRALRQISSTRAAIVQLTVPALATAGGILFLGEQITLRFALCSLLILGGVALFVTAKDRQR